MNIENLCINCMREKINLEEKCPFCGYDRSRDKEPVYALLPFTILNEKYLVGKVANEQTDTISYTGLDMNFKTKILIKEYYPREFVRRDSGINSQMRISSADSEGIVENGKKKFLSDARAFELQNNSVQGKRVKDYFEENNTAYMVLESVKENFAQRDYSDKKMPSSASGVPSFNGESSHRTASSSRPYSYQASAAKEKNPLKCL